MPATVRDTPARNRYERDVDITGEIGDCRVQNRFLAQAAHHPERRDAR